MSDLFYKNLSFSEKREFDNSFKDYLVRSGKYELWKNIRFAEYSRDIALKYGSDIFHRYEFYLGAQGEFSPYDNKLCERIYNSSRARLYRLKERVEFYLINYKCVFLTLTFRDEVLSSTSTDTRRTYISRYLKSLGCDFYVANIDFGDKDKNPYSKNREHYHAIITLPRIDLSSYPYGFIYAEKIRLNSSVNKLCKYVNKISSHSYKDSTKGLYRLIYSKKNKKN